MKDSSLSLMLRRKFEELLLIRGRSGQSHFRRNDRPANGAALERENSTAARHLGKDPSEQRRSLVGSLSPRHSGGQDTGGGGRTIMIATAGAGAGRQCRGPSLTTRQRPSGSRQAMPWTGPLPPDMLLSEI